MVEQKDDLGEIAVLPPTQQKTPACGFWGVKINRKKKAMVPHLGKFRPDVGQCCHQCTPDSLAQGKKVGQSPPSFGFQNLLCVNETHTRYRGWLVRRICCLLFVNGCKVFPSPAKDRVDRVCQSNRVREALATEHTSAVAGDSPGQLVQLSPYHPLINTCINSALLRLVSWAMLKVLGRMFCSVQINLNHVAILHKASQQGHPLVYVYVCQSLMDSALIALVLFCHHLRVPYTLCPPLINNSWLRFVLQKVGVVLLPAGVAKEDAERDSLYSSVMTCMVQELLHEGQAVSVGVSGESGQGGQWLARISQAVTDGAAPDVSLVPVGISYDCVPSADTRFGVCFALRGLWSLLWGKSQSSVRVHLAQPFSLKELCETSRCRVKGWRPLQDLLLPTILQTRTKDVFGQRMMSWLLPSHLAPELVQAERDLIVAVNLHLIYSTTYCMAVMSTALVSSLLLHRHRKGVSVSTLCRDVAWLIEEVLFRNKDVGVGGSLVEVVCYALTLLRSHITITALTSRNDPFIAPRLSLNAVLSLSLHAQIVTHTFISEAVGACAVSAMLWELACSGVSDVGGEHGGFRGDMEFDVALCQAELTDKALQLCHLLPPGCMAPCQSAQSFALDAVDSLVRCGILVMEEIPRNVPVCDVWKRQTTLTWATSDDPYLSDSDCEEQDSRSYKLSQPSQCPEMLFFLCSMLAGHLRALCWATEGLDILRTPLPEAECVAQMHSHLCDRANKDRRHYESCSEEVARTAVRTLIDLGVLAEEQQSEGFFLEVSPLFQLADNREKLHRFISQYL